jgi:esterase/lipase superfamily enzyme
MGAQVTKPLRMAITCPENMTAAELLVAAARPDSHLALGSGILADQALVFIHGFTVSHENALRRAAQLAFDTKFNGLTFAFSWPAKSDLLEYLRASRTAVSASRSLRAFLESVILQTGASKVHIIAHSMGNAVLIQAIEQILRESPKIGVRLGEVIFAAPDVDSGQLAEFAQTANTMQGRFTLYASADDRALWLSSWLWGGTRAGFIGGTPLIAKGVDTIDVTRAGMGLFALNHDVYGSNSLIIADIQKLLEKRTRPPDMRTDSFESVAVKNGVYWRIKAPPQVRTNARNRN